MNIKNYYKTKDGTNLYEFCELNNLNTFQFDILKRLIRPKKNTFLDDLEKTTGVFNLLKSYVESDKLELTKYTSKQKVHSVSYFFENWFLDEYYPEPNYSPIREVIKKTILLFDKDSNKEQIINDIKSCIVLLQIQILVEKKNIKNLD